ncbi:hypothetical protein VTO73DRAFT_13429 [Trametes versicolor]
MRARRTAPSAEFMDIVRGTTPGPVPASGAMRAEGTTTPSGDRLLGLEDGDDERSPAFISGAYGDPVFEKVQAAAAMREQYQRHDSHAAAQVEYEGEKSDVGHEDESTEAGTEEGYGFDGDEKAGYTWAIAPSRDRRHGPGADPTFRGVHWHLSTWAHGHRLRLSTPPKNHIQNYTYHGQPS